MRFLALVSIVSLVAAATALSSLDNAGAHGVTPAKLNKAGWDCFDVPGLGVHCQPPGGGASSATIPLLYFDTSDPNDDDAPFLGTEQLIRADLYRSQPCPQEGTDEWTGLDLFGGPEIDYYACHHR